MNFSGMAERERLPRRRHAPCRWTRSRVPALQRVGHRGIADRPAHPPLPTAWNLPFHPPVGSHTSILISESLVGFNVAATRQNDGSFANRFAACLTSGGRRRCKGARRDDLRQRDGRVWQRQRREAFT